MSYQAGLGPEIAPGGLPVDPYLLCDGCGARRSVTKSSGLPYSWFMNRKKAPGWKMEIGEDGKRTDWCDGCLWTP